MQLSPEARKSADLRYLREAKRIDKERNERLRDLAAGLEFRSDVEKRRGPYAYVDEAISTNEQKARVKAEILQAAYERDEIELSPQVADDIVVEIGSLLEGLNFSTQKAEEQYFANAKNSDGEFSDAEKRGRLAEVARRLHLSFAETCSDIREDFAIITSELVLKKRKRENRTFRDRYPQSLEEVREDMDYWVSRQGEGVKGSDWEEGVRNRLEHLRNLEQRLKEGWKQPALTRSAKFVTALDTYTRIGQLGAGGSGTVYEVRGSDNETYALKQLGRQIDTKRLQRFKNEIWFCSKSNHKNIISVLDHGIVETEDGARPFYVMPRYHGTLRTLLSAGISHDRVLSLFMQVLEGVAAAHLQNVFHRDLKPENVLYDEPKDTLLISDFGIAHFAEDDLYTAVETSNHDRLANFQYSAPEQRVRHKPVDQRADIYALGLILNEMFTSQILQGVGFKKISEIAPRYSYLDDVISQMVQHEPERRPTTLQVVKDQLAARLTAKA
jgi:tRNA A-37 threonylcarbamoyl transferase component Bud32